MDSLIELFDWVVTIAGIIVLLMFIMKAIQKEETPLLRLLASINAFTIKMGAVSALIFLLILHYHLTGGVLSVKSIGFYVAVGSILLTIVQGWGLKAEVLESVGTVVVNKAKEVQGRMARMVEDAKRSSAHGENMKTSQPPVQWYYAEGKERKGPLSTEQFTQLAASGTVNPNTMVWKKGIAAWTPASQIEGLFPSTEDTPPPVPADDEPPQVPV